MTPKILAKPTTPNFRYYKLCPTIITQDGRKFTWGHLDSRLAAVSVGDIVWIAKRTNASVEDWCLELYQITIVSDPRFPKFAKTWFDNGRDIVFPI